MFIDRHDGRAGRIDRERLDSLARQAGLRHRGMHSGNERTAMIIMTLGRKIRIFALAQHRVLGGAQSKSPPLTVDK